MRSVGSSFGHLALGATATALLLVATLASSPAAAAGYLSMQAGVLGPWQGDTGYSLGLQMLGGGASGRARFGAEFQYSNFDTHILGVQDVDLDAYALRAVWQQHFMPDAIVTPYMGLTFGVTFTKVDDNRVNSILGRNARDGSGVGLEGQFLFGIDAAIPNTEYLSVFAEARVGFGYEFSERNDKSLVEEENIGGIHGITGIRFRF